MATVNGNKSANFSVIARIRPLKEDQEETRALRLIDNNQVCLSSASSEANFSFDHVHGESSTQEEVFKQLSENTLEKVLNGFNCTILAYGQTGSGKTYTMIGEEKDGVIPRVCDALFKAFETQREKEGALEVTVKVNFVEIYMEKIFDLLAEEDKVIKVREAKNGTVYLEGVQEYFCSSLQELMKVFDLGVANRKIGATRMNLDSSRSHSLFTLAIEKKSSSLSLCSKLVLVDLAGSEMIKKTGAIGERLEEAKSINQSLSCLGNVILALSEGRSNHVPYRDSRLTRLLEDSLGGTAYTTLIITLSPSSSNHSETLSTLRFGQRAKKVKNLVKQNRMRSNEELEMLLEKAYALIDRLRSGGAEEAVEKERERERERERDKEEEIALRLEAVLLSQNELKLQLVKSNQTCQETSRALEEKQRQLDCVKEENVFLVKKLFGEEQEDSHAVRIRRSNTFPLDAQPISLITKDRENEFREDDVRALTEKCIQYQIELIEKEEELERAFRTGQTPMLHREREKERKKESSSLRAEIETLRTKNDFLKTQLKNRDAHLSNLELVLREVQKDFLQKVELQQQRENVLENEVKRLKNLVAAMPVVVERKVVAYEKKETQLVPFSFTYNRADIKDLKRMRERSFSFSNQSFVIEQDYESSLQPRALASPSYGAAVFACDVLLAEFFSRRGELFQGKKLLFLGVGCGLSAIVLNRFSVTHSMVLTDGDADVCKLCERNVKRNEGGEGRKVFFQVLDWTDLEAVERLCDAFGPFDYVIGSDIVALPYKESLLGLQSALLRLKERKKVGFRFLLSYKKRSVDESSFFTAMDRVGFSRRQMEDLSADFHNSDATVFEFT